MCKGRGTRLYLYVEIYRTWKFMPTTMPVDLIYFPLQLIFMQIAAAWKDTVPLPVAAQVVPQLYSHLHQSVSVP